MYLHPVKSRRPGALRGIAKGLDDARQLLGRQTTGNFVGLRAETGEVNGVIANGAVGTRDRLAARVDTGVCRPARVPELHDDTPAPVVHRIGHHAPGSGAAIIENPGLLDEGAGIGRDHGGFGDQQAGAGALGVVTDHQLVG